MTLAASGLTSLLKDFEIKRIEKSADSTFIIDKDFVLRGFNPAWTSFAVRNGGDEVLKKYGVGTSVVLAFPEPLKNHYVQLYKRVLSSCKRIDSEYECSSDQVYRKLQQSLYPLAEAKGILISNHILIEKLHDEPPEIFSERHRNKDGFIVQCSHCRRTKRQDEKDQWDWIPEFVRKIPHGTSHGLCQRCIAFYYPDLAEQIGQKY